MITTCSVCVTFFAVLAAILIAHYSGMASSRKNGRHGSGHGDSFGGCFEKAVHEVVFDSVSISAAAKRRQNPVIRYPAAESGLHQYLLSVAEISRMPLPSKTTRPLSFPARDTSSSR